MGVYRQFPYSNFHDLNLDWLTSEMKRLIKEWSEHQEKWKKLYNDVTEAFDTFQNEFESWLNGFETESNTVFNNWFQTFKTNSDLKVDARLSDYDAQFRTFMNNINVQSELRTVLERMIIDGTLSIVLQPYISPTVDAWLDEHVQTPSSPPLDNSLTMTNAAATASVVGGWVKTNRDFIFQSNPIPANFVDIGLCRWNWTWGEIVGVSRVDELAYEANTTICNRLVKVKPGDVVYMGCDYVPEYGNSEIFSLFCWDGDHKFIKRIWSTHRIEIDFDGYVTMLLHGTQYPQQVLDRKFYLNLNKFTGWTQNNLLDS